MKVLVVGSGGREHALCWAISNSPLCDALYCAPGNAGIADVATLVPIGSEDVDALVRFVQDTAIDFVVVGPEGPLVLGLVDKLTALGVKAFGPSAAAAELEGSKGFMKDILAKYGVPTAFYERFKDPEAAKAYVRKHGAPIVVKADGLAAGKGVVVAMTPAEAHEAIDFMLLDNQLGVSHNAGGARVVIEEFLQGEEASFIVLCDGRNVVPLASSQDHKRLLDGDQGPNTGGMGAYSPAPVVTPQVHSRAMHDVILPTVKGMESDGIPYTGFLYAGLMIDAEGRPKTLEFNCRMGDPETQPIMMRLRSDFFDVMMAATAGTLDQLDLQWDRRVALGVVMAAAGYPLQPRHGDPVTGLPKPADDAMVFHAGTVRKDGAILTSGGRVLCVTALADSVKAAQQRAYEVVRGIQFDGAQYRRDIGHRAVQPGRGRGNP